MKKFDTQDDVLRKVFDNVKYGGLSAFPSLTVVVNVPTTLRVELFALVNFVFPVFGCNYVVLLSHLL